MEKADTTEKKSKIISLVEDYNVVAEKLYEQIQDTKECRIRAYNRCRFWSILLNIMSGLYGSLVVILSIMVLALNNKFPFIEYILISLSIISLVFNFIVNGLSFEEKYHDYKESFNRLEKILIGVRFISFNTSENKMLILKEIHEKYIEEVSSSRNHQDIDYFQYKIDTYHRNLGKTNDQDYLAKWNSIRKQYRKYKCIDFLYKVMLTFGLYIFYSVGFCIIYCFNKIYDVVYRKR